MDEQASLSTESVNLFDDVTDEDIAEMSTSEDEAKPSEPAGEVKKDETPKEEEAPEAKPSEPEESYTLHHLGKEVKVNRKELMDAAERGLDYGRIRAHYDRIEGLARQSGVSVEDFLSTLDQRANETMINQRAQELLASGEYNENSARKMAEMEYRLNRQEKADQERQEAESRQAAFRQSIGDFVMNNPEFIKEFPNAELPADMIADLNNGMDINGAWARHQLFQERKANEEMKKQLAEYEQKKKNIESAAPSIKPEMESGEKDPFLEGLMASRW